MLHGLPRRVYLKIFLVRYKGRRYVTSELLSTTRCLPVTLSNEGCFSTVCGPCLGKAPAQGNFMNKIFERNIC